MKDIEYIHHAFQGNNAAIQLGMMIVKIADVWDNLIDGDVEVNNEDINQAFWYALVEIPRNPFYRAHVDELHPLFANGILNWHIANQLVKDAPDSKRAVEIAHVLRYSIGDVISHMAMLIGGVEWARKVGPELRMRCQRDTLENFSQEVANENQK